MLDKIVAKSGLKIQGLLNKKHFGATKVEIQLLKEFVNNDMDFDSCVGIVGETGLEVTAVHLPIINELNIEIECLREDATHQVFQKACKLAEKFAVHFKKPVLVIMHIGWSFSQFEKDTKTLEITDNRILEALDQNKNIEIGIENVIPIIKRSGFAPDAKNGYLFDNVDYCTYFCEKYKSNRLGTVLDTCHIITTIRFFNILKQYGMTEVDYTVEEFFQRNANPIKLIHLANVRDLGYKPFTHGIPFTDCPSDMQLLKDIIELYHKYSFDCPVTIEVLEKDYNNCINFAETFNSVKKVYSTFIAKQL